MHIQSKTPKSSDTLAGTTLMVSFRIDTQQCERRLLALEKSVSCLTQLIKDIDNRSQMRILEMENKLLTNVLTARKEGHADNTRTRQSSISTIPPYKSTTEPLVFDDENTRKFGYATPSSPTTQDPIALETNPSHTRKRKCPCLSDKPYTTHVETPFYSMMDDSATKEKLAARKSGAASMYPLLDNDISDWHAGFFQTSDIRAGPFVNFDLEGILTNQPMKLKEYVHEPPGAYQCCERSHDVLTSENGHSFDRGSWKFGT